MSKRQLSSKYKELVNYVNEVKKEDMLVQILDDATRQANDSHNSDNELWQILDKLYITRLSGGQAVDLVETIIDIYNGNYELEETKYYWKFKELYSEIGFPLYAFKYSDIDSVGLQNRNNLEDDLFTKMSKSTLASLLSESNLTSDNFVPMEDLD